MYGYYRGVLDYRKSKKKSGKPVVFRTFGGDKRDRTADLLNAMSTIREQNEF